ncbi:hypothetical protein [Leptolyngbya sp. PCC 6406]|uniref:hypothetical protein n=1 Tax=Leptolyngbya sp. PCC 6406 TaxID=1173264 RepID=UPI0002ABC583|nr:hypothetical protein [Leptolyngbya sp. PCC 6406]
MAHPRRFWLRRAPWLLGGLLLAGTLGSCQAEVVEDYTVTAITTYTWAADYRPAGVSPDRPSDTRQETFATSQLVMENNQRPANAVGAADAQGLWWPSLPPQPTVDELEARQRERERASAPRVIQSVAYQLTFALEGEQRTLPMQYPVYRKALQAQSQGSAIAITLAPGQGLVTQVEAVSTAP